MTTSTLDKTQADRDLERRVAAFLASRNVPALRLIHVEAHEGRVTLRGRVRSFYEKQLGQHSARNVPGVVELVDAIEVAQPREGLTSRVRFSLSPAVLGYLTAAILVVATFGTTGYSKSDDRLPVFAVSGTVKIGGAPAAGALVVFHPKNPEADAPRPSAYADAQGQFKLTSYDSGDGAPVGEYAITVELRKVVVQAGEAKLGPNVLDPKFSLKGNTTLQARVTEGPNNLPEFNVGRGPTLQAARPHFVD